MKREIITVNNFYKDPDKVIAYAMTLRYYNPYANNWRGSNSPEAMANTNWHASHFIKAKDCPFKSSSEFIRTLESLTGEEVDLEHWNKDFPEDPATGALLMTGPHIKDPTKEFVFANLNNELIGARWHCGFHVKHTKHAAAFDAVHDHVEDGWNHSGMDGWTGLIYLNRDAPRDAGLQILKNKYGNDRERYVSPDRWELVDDFGNVFNRLLLVRGWMPHQGGNGWGNSLTNGRLFQTLFFKTKKPVAIASVDIPLHKGPQGSNP